MGTVDKIKTVEQSFDTLKQVGADGIALSQLTYKTIENMKQVVDMFESGTQSQEWATNFQQIAGTEGMILAGTIYEEFKRVLVVLDEYSPKQ